MANVGVEGAKRARSAIVGDDAKRPCAREGTKSPESGQDRGDSRATAQQATDAPFQQRLWLWPGIYQGKSASLLKYDAHFYGFMLKLSPLPIF